MKMNILGSGIRYRKTVSYATIREALAASAALYPDNVAVHQKIDGVFTGISYSKLYSDVNALGTYLCSKGLQGRHFMLIGENCYEWCVSYFAVACGAGTVIPVDCETKAKEILSYVEMSDSTVVFYSEKCGKYIREAFEDRENVPTLFCFSDFYRFIAEGKGLIARGDTSYTSICTSPDDIACMFFTSGTTGASKGVMLSNRNICFDISEIGSMLRHSTDDVFFAALPMHHAYTCTCSFLFPIFTGASVAICEGLRYITKDMKAVRPTIICCVPSLVETMYRKINAGIAKHGKFAENGAHQLQAMTRDNMKVKKLVFRKIHDSFGGRLRLIITGGAACDPSVIRGMMEYGFFTIQGYGLTECAPLAAVNMDSHHKDGSAGLPTPHGVIDIYDIRKDGTGEIRYKGDNVMVGYYKNPEATAEVIRDGWFYTGDLGYLDKDGFLFITGRSKNVIVTNGGKNIFPEELETQLRRHPIVNEAVVVAYPNDVTGDLDVVAVIHPDASVMQEKYGRQYNRGQLEAEISAAVNDVNGQNVRYKHIRYFVTREKPFEYNGSHKIMRAAVSEESREAYMKKMQGSGE